MAYQYLIKNSSSTCFIDFFQCLVSTQIYLVVLQHFFLFSTSRSFKVPYAIHIMLASPCGLFTTPCRGNFQWILRISSDFNPGSLRIKQTNIDCFCRIREIARSNPNIQRGDRHRKTRLMGSGTPETFKVCSNCFAIIHQAIIQLFINHVTLRLRTFTF